MSAWLRTLWNGLLFREPAFTDLRDRRDAFLQGVLVIAVIALLVGAPAFVGNIAKAIRPGGIEAELDQALTEFDNVMQQVAPFLGNMPAEARNAIVEQVKENMQLGFGVAKEMDKLPTILPKPLNALFEAVGKWVSAPFAEGGLPLGAAALGTWLGYGLWVMLFAKLLGGRGGLVSFFGTTALYAVPHVLNILGGIPILGGVVGLIAFVWGWVIYIKATQVSHQLTIGRAVLAAFLPLLLMLVLGIIGVSGLVTLIALSAGGSQ